MRAAFVLPMIAAIALGGAIPAEAQFKKPSEKQQIQLGKQAADEIRHKEKTLPSSDARVRVVRRVGQRLMSAMKNEGPWEFSFDVIESKEMNAFALPGGPTFVYTGLLDKLRTEDELAGILGHELTHVTRQHWANQYAEQQKRNLFLSLGLTILRVNRDLSNVVGLSNSLLSLRFSRDKEQEADDGGFDLMVNAGYNPQGMADVFTLLREQAKGGKMPEFLSDHPADDRRIRHIEDRIKTSGRAYPESRPLNVGS